MKIRLHHIIVIAAAISLVVTSAFAQAGTVDTSGVGTAGVHISSTASFPDVDVKTGDTTAASFRIFNSANSELFRVTATGRVGIGTATPLHRVHIYENADFQTKVLISNPHTGPEAAATFKADSNVAFLTLVSHGSGRTLTRYGQALAGTSELLHWGGNAFIIGSIVNNAPVIFGTSNLERVRIAGDGKVGIGVTNPSANLHVAGDAVFTGTVSGGNIQAKYQDVAEWVPAIGEVGVATVVVVAADAANTVTASTEPYDTRVAGVVSAEPGLILGEPGESKIMVATTGRVKVKVDATAAPVKAGDLLVTSTKSGMAMRSEPVEIGSVKLHRPGTVIGKALEPLASGTGEILVLLSLQ